MKIDKQFAPMTITIEDQEDLKFLFAVLQDAERNYMSHGPIFCSPRKYTDTYMMKIKYIMDRLK